MSKIKRRPKRTRTEVVTEDSLACKLNKEDAMDSSKWRKLIKGVRWSRWVWVGEFLLVPAYLGSPWPKAVKRLCVVCVCEEMLYIFQSMTLCKTIQVIFVGIQESWAQICNWHFVNCCITFVFTMSAVSKTFPCVQNCKSVVSCLLHAASNSSIQQSHCHCAVCV